MLQDAAPSSRELGARQLAGYRVLRSLARDDDAEVVLGHRVVRAETPEPAVQTVAIKMSASTDRSSESVLHECAALERARGDHVVDLLDVDAEGESIRLIFERLPRGDLSELLRIRSRLDAGEAVTLLAPIAVTLMRLHAAGVAHGNLSPSSVLFRDDGSPTLIGFSRAELFEPGAPEVVLEQVDAVQRDRAAALGMAATVLARVTGARAREARELQADLEGCDAESVLPLLASRLFEVAAAVAVRFVADDIDENAASTPRAVPLGAGVVEAGVAEREAPGLVAALARFVPESLVQRVLDGAQRHPATPVVSAVASTARRRWRTWTPGRRRIVLAAGAAAVTVGIVTAAMPAGATRPASGPLASPSGVPSAGASGAPSEDLDPAITADDPVAAAGALLHARQRCLSTLSLPCLDRVDETASEALGDDQSSIRSALQGGELPEALAADAPVLIERLGDSALVRLGDSSSAPSLLLVKREQGWRIRDVIAARAPTGTPSPTHSEDVDG